MWYKRRKHERKHLNVYLKVFNRDTDQLVGRLCDITPEGFMHISEQPIGTDISLSLRVEFPEDVDGQKHLDN